MLLSQILVPPKSNRLQTVRDAPQQSRRFDGNCTTGQLQRKSTQKQANGKKMVTVGYHDDTLWRITNETMLDPGVCRKLEQDIKGLIGFICF